MPTADCSHITGVTSTTVLLQRSEPVEHWWPGRRWQPKRRPSHFHQTGTQSHRAAESTVAGRPVQQEASLKQVCSGPLLETGATSTVLTTSSSGSSTKQSSGNKCSLCGEGKGELVPTSLEWQQALWLAEKRIITQIQPQVMSPILARYAAAAYRLRQKPSGWCCSSCAEWVWNQLNDPCQPREVLTPVGQVWPQLGEAAITGPIYFNVDFAQENLTPQGEASDSLAQDDTTGVATSTPGEDSRGRPQDAGQT